MKRERTDASSFRQPAVLALAGLDPSGRAGLLADLAAIRESGGAGLGIATALTAQGRTTFAVAAVPPSILRAQLRMVRELSGLRSIKLGMVPDRPALRDICAQLSGLSAFWVVDPVTRTSAGQRLSRLRAADYLALADEKRVLTPNLLEAGWLLSSSAPPRTLEQAAEAGRELVRRGFAAVVVKGGHRSTDATDVLCEADAVHYLRGPKLKRDRTRHRGTGCRFASALATSLARGRSMSDAAREAKACVTRFLAT